jgi:hypothetical protein
VLIKDGICTLINVVITDSTQVELLHQSCTTQGFVAFDAAQAKKTELSRSTFRRSIPPFSNGSIWMFTYKSGCVFTQLCQCYLEFEKIKWPSSFYFGYFSSAKDFNHIVKATNIFHLKSGGSHRPSYFPTSTPSRHTSHLHDQLIANGRFWIWKNMVDLLQAIDF